MRESVVRESEESARAERRRGFIHNLDMVSTSFFITNFPLEATTEELRKLFRKFGMVGEVYIPKKLDIKGRRFGFVKFKEVTDVTGLSESLKNVWLGTYKIWVNRSRFGRSDSRESGAMKMTPHCPAAAMKEIQPGKSFRNAVLGRVDGESPVMKVNINEALCLELRGSMVGTLSCVKDVRRIQTTLYMEGFQSISVTYMGGNMALLRSSLEGDVERLLKSEKDTLD